MAFHGMMLLRDEQDVIAQCLEHLLTWIDGLYILDLGSTDRTWEIVQDFAKRDKRIVPHKTSPIIYNDNLRCYLFHHYRDRFYDGDWVMKIDADEFYHIPPPQFIREQVSASEGKVNLQWFFFRMTTQELEAYESGRVNVMADRQRPMTDRRRYYKVSTYSEPRMFKYRRTMRWSESSSLPYHTGLMARARIPIRHYPHRDPLQMRARFALRSAMMKLKAHAGGHWKLDDWRKELVDEAGVSTANKEGIGTAVDNVGIDVGPLYYWKPGTQLPMVAYTNHLSKGFKRMAEVAKYTMLTGYLDGKQKHYNPAYEPDPIPPHIQDDCRAAMLDVYGGTLPPID